MPEKELTAAELANKYGYWDEHPFYTVSNWQYDVANGDTRKGYWNWVEAMLGEGED